MATSPVPSSATAAADLIAGGRANTASETIVGSYVFRIEGFSKTKDLDVGESIRSSTFRVGGHGWYINCYPCGYYDDDDDCARCVSLDLCLDHPGPNDKVEAGCYFALMDYVGDQYFPNEEEIKQWTYSIADNSCVLDFIEREDLKSLLKGDCFQVRCDVSILREFPAVPSPNLHLRLGDLLVTGPGGDVTFEVGGELFTAHKYILAARSSVFMEDLLSPWREKTTIRVRIDDMEWEVFKALLHFNYTDSLNVVVEDGDKVTLQQHLLVVADKYNMETLKSICEDILCNYIDASMAATTLMLADKHGCHKLKEACMTFLTNLLASVQGPAAGQGSNQMLLTGKRQRC